MHLAQDEQTALHSIVASSHSWLANNIVGKVHDVLWCDPDDELPHACSWWALSAGQLERRFFFWSICRTELPKGHADNHPSLSSCHLCPSAFWDCFAQAAVYLSKRKEMIEVTSFGQFPPFSASCWWGCIVVSGLLWLQRALLAEFVLEPALVFSEISFPLHSLFANFL